MSPNAGGRRGNSIGKGKKLWRDLATLKGQIAAIVVVLAAGVMTLIVFLTTLDALSATQDRFYEEHRFADLFADLVRAPDAVGERLRDLPGVEQVETRVRAAVRLEVEGFPDPVRGHLLLIPDGRQPEINRLYLREGRLPVSGRSDEVVVSEAFATAHRLRAGDRLRVIIRGSLEELTITPAPRSARSSSTKWPRPICCPTMSAKPFSR